MFLKKKSSSIKFNPNYYQLTYTHIDLLEVISYSYFDFCGQVFLKFFR